MKNKRIMIDFRNICETNGFSTYLKYILNAINNIDALFFLLVNEDAKNFNFENFVNLEKIKLVQIKSKAFSLFSNIEIPFVIFKNKIDIYHAINFNIPIFIPKKCCLISTIHDIIPIKYKNLHKRNIFIQLYFNIMYKLAVNLSDIILTVSNYSKQDIIDFFKIDDNKVKVIYNTYIPTKKSINKREKDRKYKTLFFIGTNFEHKNILAVIKAVKILVNKGYDIRFNIAGSERKYTETLKQAIINDNLENYIKIWGRISYEQLKKLYQLADYYVFPSLVEGFGIPLLEAMNYGLPIISSNKTVMPEVIGDAGILIDPTPENFAEAVENLIKNPKLASDLINKGYQQMKNFSQENFNKSYSSLIQGLKNENLYTE